MNRISDQDRGRTMTAIILIGIGAFFLLAQVFDFGNIMGLLWPLLVILPGLAFLVPALRGGPKEAGLAMPGFIVTGTGLILAYQNLTGHWESWAYIWALYPVMVGLGLEFIGRKQGDQPTMNVGGAFIKYGGVAFIILAAIFELAVFERLGGVGSFVAPLLLIGLGILLLGQRGFNFGAGKPKRTVVGARVTAPSANGSRLEREIDAALREDEPKA